MRQRIIVVLGPEDIRSLDHLRRYERKGNTIPSRSAIVAAGIRALVGCSTGDPDFENCSTIRRRRKRKVKNDRTDYYTD